MPVLFLNEKGHGKGLVGSQGFLFPQIPITFPAVGFRYSWMRFSSEVYKLK